VAHAGFLRDHHPGPEQEVITLIRGLADAGDEAAEMPMRAGLAHVIRRLDELLRQTPSLAMHRELLAVVARLTLAPRLSTDAGLQALRDEGYSDRELHDLVHVVCCFSYMNRVADGLGVTAHPDDGGWAERLMGAERLATHRRWAEGTRYSTKAQS